MNFVRIKTLWQLICTTSTKVSHFLSIQNAIFPHLRVIDWDPDMLKIRRVYSECEYAINSIETKWLIVKQKRCLDESIFSFYFFNLFSSRIKLKQKIFQKSVFGESLLAHWPINFSSTTRRRCLIEKMSFLKENF